MTMRYGRLVAVAVAVLAGPIAGAEGLTQADGVLQTLLVNASGTLFALAAPTAVAIGAFGLIKGMFLSVRGAKPMAEGFQIFKNTLVSFGLLMLVAGLIRFVGSSAGEVAGLLH